MKPELFLADTTVWVTFLRGKDSSIRDRLTALVREDRVFMTELIMMEILRGAKSDKEYVLLREDFLALPQISFGPGVWEAAWRSAYQLRKNGVNAPLADVLIASLSMQHHCTLLHSDKHFNLMAKHMELKAIEL